MAKKLTYSLSVNNKEEAEVLLAIVNNITTKENRSLDVLAVKPKK
ncbi:MAG: hypothetical protein AAGI07_19475 [Bacteroidota bacterium]